MSNHIPQSPKRLQAGLKSELVKSTSAWNVVGRHYHRQSKISIPRRAISSRKMLKASAGIARHYKDAKVKRPMRKFRRRCRIHAVSTHSDDDWEGSDLFETSSLAYALRASERSEKPVNYGFSVPSRSQASQPTKRSKHICGDYDRQGSSIQNLLRLALGREEERLHEQQITKHTYRSSKRQATRRCQEGNDVHAAKDKPDLANSKTLSSTDIIQNAFGSRRKEPRTASDRLKGAKFRMLNEMLYTASGDKAFETFSQAPELFQIYHQGFVSQVNKWPVNPVDEMIEYILRLPSSLVIADFGCGEAKIARSVLNKVHSFDLVAGNEYVTACNIANVPLEDNSVDIAVFCLALMGTNYPDYLTEAYRVLNLNGRLKIAEVKSRIKDTDKFISVISAIGFEFTSMDDSNKMFVSLEFVKSSKKRQVISNKLAAETLQPCIYKRR